jgi:hypothetical protein
MEKITARLKVYNTYLYSTYLYSAYLYNTYLFNTGKACGGNFGLDTIGRWHGCCAVGLSG